ncbi:DoxX family protein [Pollutimonas sp. M17]|uniref:DoxX family protein n=1 Tax=Pollutimonas sp. M17 TaxID=2962065 RepID=UPI0021F4D206|nr:DoxX family protein [Pollutimonas sp. M17]UYO94603.1 DoxX family protein [Pollutimonas sp. M17]HWK69679.1 DoxX family protein [Burkholderiaceae bacterium]
MSPTTLDDLGKLVLRLTIGVLILFHGVAKLLHGIGPIESMIVARGMPAFFAWAVYIGEVLAPLFLILGFYTRLGGLLIAVNMLVAIALAHMGHMFELSGTGGWRLELQGLYLFGSLAVALLGAGRYSMGGKGGNWN